MNKNIVLFFIFFLFYLSFGTYAQMSDSQVVEYVQREHSKGVSETEIGSELIRRGVTQSQLERIKSQKDNYSTTSSSKKVDSPEEVLRSSDLDDDNVIVEEEKSDSKIYGHNIFNRRNLSYLPSMNIPTPVNYKLGAGDEVVIEIWGVSETVYRKVITPDGSISIEGVGPIYLNGLTIDEADKYVRKKISAIYTTLSDEKEKSNFKLSLGQTRTIQINVMGEVKTPGTYNISSLSSLFHAIYKANGVSEIGSLRAINLYRNGKKEETVDIYEFLMTGKFSNDIRLEDGDVIIVPAYEALVEINGQVKRPMIYEMRLTETFSDIVNYAGGWSKGANLNNISLDRKTNRFKQIYTVNPEEFSTFNLVDGDIISVGKGVERYENRVEVKGSVYHPGYYEINERTKTIKDLIFSAGGFKEDVFYDRAVLIREKEDLTLEAITLNLNYLDSSEDNIELKPNDKLYIKSKIINENFGPFVISGMVANPGEYEYVENTTVKDLVFMAGGLLTSASTVSVEISRRIIEPDRDVDIDTIAEVFSFVFIGGLEANKKAEFVLLPYDRVVVRKSPSYQKQKDVSLTGEVLFPGNYTLQSKGERISNVIERAGGLTKFACPKGTRLIRVATEVDINRQKEFQKLLEKERSDSTINIDMEGEYSVGIDLQKALKYPKSHYDIVLKDGDKIIIPEFTNTVKVSGAVMQPNTMVYEDGKNVKYFIKEAGGYSRKAEKRRAYIVYMNGKGKRASKLCSKIVEPGCEIVIPFKEERERMTFEQTVALSSTVASMASVVALLINALAK